MADDSISNLEKMKSLLAGENFKLLPTLDADEVFLDVYKRQVLCCGLFVCTIARAESDKDEPSNTKSEVAQVNNDDLTKQVNKLLSILPKFSGYIQTGYNWGDKNGDNRSSFQLKRMRLIIDKKVSKTFDFRAQLECCLLYTSKGNKNAISIFHLAKINYREFI